ncbi:Ms4527A family Cys-rich leader peptide [Mycolicibacterium pulveris]|uniref:Ms4527A family Cys-rich leader peptide n=1 Tax=Mycolicibacterium pulveris TaxID=36813 RepID=UPI0038995756
MPNAPPGVSARPGSSAGAVRGVMRPVSQTSSAHLERKYRPVRAHRIVHGTIGVVTAARIFPRISLVARRHVDFKRVCTCCCLP